jgi:periplasmic copper chaperone A
MTSKYFSQENKMKSAFTLVLGLAFSSVVSAQVSVGEPWVRASVPQQKATGVFMKLTSKEGAKLVAVKSPAAAVVEIHEMTMDNNVMKMRALPSLALPAGKTVELRPGSYHVMLIDLKAQIKDGDTVPVTLTVESADGKRSEIEVKAPARPLNAAAPKEDAHKGMKH